MKIDSMEKRVVLKFPLCLLTMNLPTFEKLQYIIAFGMSHKNEPYDSYLLSNDENILLIEEIERTKEEVEQSYSIADRYYSEYIRKIGKEDAWVQVNSKICVETMNGNSPYDLFALICAVSSVVGQDVNRKIGWTTIEHLKMRMSGYKSKRDFDRLIKCPIYDANTGEVLSLVEHPFSSYDRMKITRLRNKAEKMKFFSSFYSRKVNNQYTYYSTHFKNKLEIGNSIINLYNLQNQAYKEESVVLRNIKQEMLNARFGVAPQNVGSEQKEMQISTGNLAALF